MMVALLVGIAIAAVVMAGALPAWSTMARREREAELVWRGEQYARAIQLFQRRYAGTYPPSFDVLVNDRFLRKKYKDPITGDDFKPIGVGDAVSGPQAANPFAPGGQQPAGAAGAGRTGTPPGQPASRTGGAGATAGAGATGGRGATQPGRSTFQLGAGQGGTRTGAFGQAGATPGIMGVTSKSEDASLRLYKGADHYNQWLFIGTLATAQAGGRGAPTPGDGTRGGPPGPVGGPRGANPPGGPRGFGGAPPFGGGRAPAPPPLTVPGRGR